MEITKQNKSKSYKEFEKLLNSDLEKRSFKENQIACGTVEEVGKKHVFLDLGLKASAAIPLDEFKLTNQLDLLKPGKKIEVLLERLENRDSQVVASFEKARRAKSWSRVEAKFKAGETCTGKIISKCRGGMVVDSDGCLMFLPGSQISLRPQRDYSSMMKVPLEFAIVKMDKKRGNIVCSHRQVLEASRDKDKAKILSTIKVGDIVEGVVKNITDWGAFIDIAGGIDSLLHITNCSWSRINSPHDLLSISEHVRVKITKIDPKTKKVECSIKDLTEDPWLKNIQKYKVGETYTGTITKLVPYGAFCKLEDSLEGLIHASEISRKSKQIDPSKVLANSMRVKVVLLEKNLEKRQISLSYRLTQPDPWKKLKADHKVGDVIEGIVKNITDFGLFVSLAGYDLDSLIHWKDLQHDSKVSDLQRFKKHQKINFCLLEINEEASKIRGGIKQLTEDSFAWLKDKEVGETITVTVDHSTHNGIYTKAGPKNFSIFIKKLNLAKDFENQRESRFVREDKIDVIIISKDNENRKCEISIKALEEKQAKEKIKRFGSAASGGILSDIFDFSKIKTKKPKSKK